MSSFRLITTLVFLMTFLRLHSHDVDSVESDLKQLSGVEFFKKYSLNENKVSNEDIKIIKLIWSVHHLKEENEFLRQKGIKTITIIENKPSKQEPYYIIGYYQLSDKTDHMFRVSLYKISSNKRFIYFEHWYDSINKKWERVN